MKNKLFLLLLICTLLLFQTAVLSSETATIRELIAALKHDNRKKISAMIAYPLPLNYALGQAHSPEAFLGKFDEIFDRKYTQIVMYSNPDRDWENNSFWGIEIKNGKIIRMGYEGENTAILGIRDFIDALKNNDREKVASLIDYPLPRRYPLSPVTSSADFLERFDEIIDVTRIPEITHSHPHNDWVRHGYHGIRSEWAQVNDRGLINVIYFETEKENQHLERIHAQREAGLYPPLRNAKKNMLLWKSTRYIIRIDQLADDSFRYSVWPKNTPLSSKPDLTLMNGTRAWDGSAGNHIYTFQRDAFTYICTVSPFGGAGEDTPYRLTVLHNNHVVISDSDIVLIYE